MGLGLYWISTHIENCIFNKRKSSNAGDAAQRVFHGVFCANIRNVVGGGGVDMVQK